MNGIQVKPSSLAVKFFSVSIAYFILSVTLGIAMLLGVGVGVRGSFQAHVHIALLGFVTLTIMGAMYQIVPTLVGKELRSPKLAELQFWLVNIGILGLFLAFFFGRGLASMFAVIATLASYLFIYVIISTVRSGGGLLLTTKFFLSALVYFAVTLALGVVLISVKMAQPALFFKGSYLAAHTHLALLAFVTLTVMGALYQMLPMLALKELYSKKLAEVQFWLMNAGIFGFSLAMLASDRALVGASSIVIVLAVYIFIYNMTRTLTGGAKFDISVKFFASAIAYFAAACTLGVLMALFPGEIISLAPRVLSAHAHLTSMGFITLTIMGAMYHLVPMLVWMERYGEKMGVEPVPSIADMFNLRLAEAQYVLANLGVLGFFLGLLGMGSILTASALVFLVSSYLFAYIMYGVIIAKVK